MTQSNSLFIVADNSGAKVIRQITALKGSKRNRASLGDIVVCSVRRATPHGAIAKKAVVRAVIVRTTKPHTRADGTVVRFDDNAVVVIGDDKKPVGTRIFGPVAREIRDHGYREIISLAPEVV